MISSLRPRPAQARTRSLSTTQASPQPRRPSQRDRPGSRPGPAWGPLARRAAGAASVTVLPTVTVTVTVTATLEDIAKVCLYWASHSGASVDS